MYNPPAGALSTPVFFRRVDKLPDGEGYFTDTEVNVFGRDESGRDRAVMCRWVNAHGTEIFASMQMQLNEPATLTARYSPLINQTLIVYSAAEYDAALRAGDEIDDETEAAAAVKAALDKIRYEIISVDDIENRHVWLVMKIGRKVAAK